MRREGKRNAIDRSLADGLSEAEIATLAAANPSDMSADGVARYWKKYRS